MVPTTMKVTVDGAKQKIVCRQLQRRHLAAVIRRQKTWPGLPFPGEFLLRLQWIAVGNAPGV
jgi:hypothetical protein